MKTLNRDKIQRMFGQKAGGVGGSSVNTDGDGVSKLWVEQNYLSKEFFLRLFNIHGEDENDDPVDVQPNDLETTITDIEAMFGFWTEQYLSALGQNSEQGGGGITLNAALSSINNAPLGNPTGNSTVLLWNGTTWIYQTMGSTDMTAVWAALADGTDTHQINVSHLTTALGSYFTQGSGISITNTVGGTGKTISLAQIQDLTAGTYKSVTVDQYGRVTAGTNPTTLAGYGITDALASNTTFWGRTIASGAVKGGIDQASYIEFADIASGTTNGGYIDFHYGGNTTANSGDYTSRIIEDAFDATNSQGTLKINNILWAKLSTGVSIGTSTISSDYKLNVAGYTKTTRLYLRDSVNNDGGVYLEYDTANGGVHLVGAGFYADSYVSALGVNSGGGGGTDYIPLTGSDQIAGSLIPVTTNAYDLGDSTHAWRNIRGNSIFASNSITTYYLTVNSTATVGSLTASLGNITASAGNIIASTGYVSAASGFKVPTSDGFHVLVADGNVKQLKTVNGYSLFVTDPNDTNIDASGGGSGSYLPIGGGTMTGSISSAANIYPSLQAYNSAGSAYAMKLGYYPIGGYSYFSNETNQWEIRLYNNGDFKYAQWSTNTIYNVWHSGNFTPSDYLPLIGGTLSRATSTYQDSILKVNNTATHDSQRGIEIFVPNMEAHNTHYSTPLLMGKEYGLNNMCDIDFYYRGDKSTNNAMSFGFYGNDGLLFIRADGNIGIGTTSPYRRLSVSSSKGDVAILNSTSTYTCINYYVNDSAKWSVGADGSTNEFYFYSSLQGRSVVEIGSTGQIKSNIATGTSPLSVVSTTLCSNLNADLLDGQHGSYYAAASSLGSYLALVGGTMSGTIKSGSGVYPSIQALGGTDGTTPKMNLGYYPTGGYSYFSNETNKYEIRLYDNGSLYLSCFATGGNSYKIWNEGNDGTGTGLDADLLDGQHASYFATAASLSDYVTLATTQTITGTKTFSLSTTSSSASIMYLTSNYNGAWARGLDIQMPNAPTGNFISPILFGVSYGTNNYGTISFGYIGSGSTNNYVGIGFYANDNIFNVCASGNVGVGTTSPSYKLDVNGTVGVASGITLTTTKKITFGTGANAPYIEVGSDGYFHFSVGVYSDGFVSALGLNSGGGGAADYIPLSGSTSITGDLTPSNNNSVNLGSSSKLWAAVYCTNLRAYGASSIADNLTMAGNITPTVNNQYALGSSSAYFGNAYIRCAKIGSFCIEADSNGAYSASRSNEINNYGGNFHLQYDSTYGVTMCNGGGTVSIGNGSPSGTYRLYVKKHTTSGVDYGLYAGGQSYFDGRVTIGSPTNTSKNLNVEGQIWCDGDIWTHGSTADYSDMRLKEVIRYENIDVQKIADAPLFTYMWRNRQDKNIYAGTSAQYWKNAFSYFVRDDSDGFYGLYYGTAGLLASIAVARKVVDHEARIRLLEVENAALRNEINQLKKAA